MKIFSSYANTQLNSAQQRHFLICATCFWCSSWINNNKPIISKCPSCQDPVESVPLSYNEAYEFDHSRKRGVTLNFLESPGSKNKPEMTEVMNQPSSQGRTIARLDVQSNKVAGIYAACINCNKRFTSVHEGMVKFTI